MNPALTNTSATERALKAAEATVTHFHNTTHNCKASLNTGNLLFCKTGITSIFEDYTVIGPPLTTVYRLEEKTDANQIVVPKDSGAGELIYAQVEEHKAVLTKYKPSWFVDTETWPLRGIGDLEIVKQVYRPQQR